MRYVGEPVAAVFADDPYLAEDAADLVELEIDPLPVILDAAAQPGAFDDERSTEATVIEKKSGDIDAAFRAADMIVELDLRDRPAQRRAAGDARRHRALRRRTTTCWKCTAPPRCRTGTATGWR